MILYVDSDTEDQYLFKLALVEIGCKRKLLCFPNGEKLIKFLEATDEKPFMIICDLRTPHMSGHELRRAINSREHLREKAIPFIFFSQLIKRADVMAAYNELVQGFFRKPADFDEYKVLLHSMISYWSKAIHPGSPDLEDVQNRKD